MAVDSHEVDFSGGPLPPEQLQLMIRSMLEDRFQLKAHMETRDLPIYNLVVTKDGGPKLKQSEDQTPLGAPAPLQACSPVNTPQGPQPPPPAAAGSLLRGRLAIIPNPNGLTVVQGATPIANLANALEIQVGRPVIDKTDINGLYDFKFTFSPRRSTGLAARADASGRGSRAISIQRDTGAWVETGIHERTSGRSGCRLGPEANLKLNRLHTSLSKHASGPSGSSVTASSTTTQSASPCRTAVPSSEVKRQRLFVNKSPRAGCDGGSPDLTEPGGMSPLDRRFPAHETRLQWLNIVQVPMFPVC